MNFKNRKFESTESLESSLEQLKNHMDANPIESKNIGSGDVLVSLSDWEPKHYGVDEIEPQVTQEQKRVVDKNSDGYVVSQVYELPQEKKNDRAMWLYENMGNLCKWFFGKESNRVQDGGVDALGNTLLADLSHKKVASAIKMVSESTDKEYNFPLESVALLGRVLGFLNTNKNLIRNDEDHYAKISEKIYRSGLGVLSAHGRDEELLNKSAISTKYNQGKDLATDLLFVVPNIAFLDFNPNVYIAETVKSVMALLIGTCTAYEEDGAVRVNQFPFSMTDVIGIIKALYTSGNDNRYLTRVARTILLEPSSGYNGLNPQQEEALEILIDAALEIIETSGQNEALTNIIYYCKSRQYADRGGMDYPRLIEISDLEMNDFPNIANAVKSIKRDRDKQSLARYIK